MGPTGGRRECVEQVGENLKTPAKSVSQSARFRNYRMNFVQTFMVFRGLILMILSDHLTFLLNHNFDRTIHVFLFIKNLQNYCHSHRPLLYFSKTEKWKNLKRSLRCSLSITARGRSSVETPQTV